MTGRGRPSRGGAGPAQHRVHLRLTDDEYDQLAKAAQGSGTTVGPFVRDAALEAARRVNEGPSADS